MKGGLAGAETGPEFHRLGLLAGKGGMAALEKAQVIVFGLGGVGSWAAEALVRSGVGHITIVDNDAVCITNINRQIQALPDTVGLPKAAALMKRLTEINPRCEVRAFNTLFSRETAALFGIEKAGYVIDAIDSLTHKLDLIEMTLSGAAADSPPPHLYSSMGIAARLDPVRIKTADIWDTSGCPLARLVRQGLRKRGFTGHFTVVYSDEPPRKAKDVEAVCGTERCFCCKPAWMPAQKNSPVAKQLDRHGCRAHRDTEWCSSKKAINGSVVTVTAAAGMILAGLVVQDVLRFAGRHGCRPRESDMDVAGRE